MLRNDTTMPNRKGDVYYGRVTMTNLRKRSVMVNMSMLTVVLWRWSFELCHGAFFVGIAFVWFTPMSRVKHCSEGFKLEIDLSVVADSIAYLTLWTCGKIVLGSHYLWWMPDTTSQTKFKLIQFMPLSTWHKYVNIFFLILLMTQHF